MFSTRVRAAADDAGLTARPVRTTDMLQRRLARVDDGKANDPVTSVIVEIDDTDLPIELIRLARQHDAELPIIAFGPHVEVEALRAAGEAGAQPVMTRGSFHRELPAIIDRLRGLARPSLG